MDTELDQVIERKMQSAGTARPAITTFLNAVHRVAGGERGLISEQDIEPASSLPRLSELSAPSPKASAHLERLAVIKLNGGLGTSMGLDKAKSLIPLKGQETFLDFIARQILHLRRSNSKGFPAFYLMDSFATQRDTLEHLRKYQELAGQEQLDFLQSKVPKIDAGTYLPVSWPADPELEWCPPGHGDLYPSLLSSGLLERLLNRGVTCLFVSNSDNLGATVDLKLLEYFLNSGLSFLMEVAERTEADRKGGHLARHRKSGRFLLRELAQCPPGEQDAFQNISKHAFFNTNNLWIRLDHLKKELDQNGGALPLPLIRNTKTLDPKNSESPKVIQIESAMGAAIECFAQSGAMVVPRSRFSPVKTNADLLALRSDVYVVTDDSRLVLEPSRKGVPPRIDLDSTQYRLLERFDAFFSNGVPSLKNCEELKVCGPVRFEHGVVCEGNVAIVNPGKETRTLPGRRYRDEEVRL